MKNMKRLSIVLLAVILAFALTACTDTSDTGAEETAASAEETASEVTQEEAGAESADSGEPLKIAYLSKNMAVQWMQNMDMAFQELSQEYGFEYQVFDAQGTIETQMNQLDQVISEGYDGVIVLCADTGSSKAIADKCAEANLPLIAESVRMTDADGKLVAPTVELDATECGAMCSEWIVENYQELGFDFGDYSSVGFATFVNSTQPNAVQRAEGAENKFKELLPDFPEGNIFVGDVASETSGYQEAAHNIMNGFITANTEIETWLIVAVLDEYGQGVARSIEENGMVDNAILTSVGGEVAVVEWASENPPKEWYAISYYNAMDCASLCIEGMLQMLDGGVSETELWPDKIAEGQMYASNKFAGRMVTKEDYKEYVTE